MKRTAKPDMPLRVWQSNIERIAQHTEKQSKQVPTAKNPKKMRTHKPTFNEFLEVLLDVYDKFKDSQIYYANELYTDAAEARGQAILKATRTKSPIHLPKKVCVLGDDSL